MTSLKIKKQLLDYMSKLPLEQQKKVQDFAHALLITQPKGTSGNALLRFTGIISNDEASKMARAIEEGCEKVDHREW